MLATMTLKKPRFLKPQKKRKNADEAIYQKTNYEIILKGVEELKMASGIVIKSSKNERFSTQAYEHFIWLQKHKPSLYNKIKTHKKFQHTCFILRSELNQLCSIKRNNCSI